MKKNKHKQRMLKKFLILNANMSKNSMMVNLLTNNLLDCTDASFISCLMFQWDERRLNNKKNRQRLRDEREKERKSKEIRI